MSENPILDAIVNLAAILRREAQGREPRRGDSPLIELPEPYYSTLRNERGIIPFYPPEGPMTVAGIIITTPRPR